MFALSLQMILSLALDVPRGITNSTSPSHLVEPALGRQGHAVQDQAERAVPEVGRKPVVVGHPDVDLQRVLLDENQPVWWMPAISPAMAVTSAVAAVMIPGSVCHQLRDLSSSAMRCAPRLVVSRDVSRSRSSFVSL